MHVVAYVLGNRNQPILVEFGEIIVDIYDNLIKANHSIY